MNTGDWIRNARKSKNLTQTELAKRLGVTQSLIGQYERGIREPKMETLKKISAALGIPTVEVENKKYRSVVYNQNIEASVNLDVEMANLRKALADQLGREPTAEEYQKYAEFSEIFIKGLRGSGDDQ